MAGGRRCSVNDGRDTGEMMALFSFLILVLILVTFPEMIIRFLQSSRRPPCPAWVEGVVPHCLSASVSGQHEASLSYRRERLNSNTAENLLGDIFSLIVSLALLL